MENNYIIEKIISTERLTPYLKFHNNDKEKAIQHYKSNILISEAFYPLLSILEVGLRNSMDYQLTIWFNDNNWFENEEFIKIANKFQMDKISDAKANILSEKKILLLEELLRNFRLDFGLHYLIQNLK